MNPCRRGVGDSCANLSQKEDADSLNHSKSKTCTSALHTWSQFIPCLFLPQNPAMLIRQSHQKSQSQSRSSIGDLVTWGTYWPSLQHEPPAGMESSDVQSTVLYRLRKAISITRSRASHITHPNRSPTSPTPGLCTTRGMSHTLLHDSYNLALEKPFHSFICILFSANM